MGLNEDIQARLDQIIASQVKVRADIAKLSASIPEGGLTAEQAQAIKDKLDGIASEEDSQDALTPEDAPAE